MARAAVFALLVVVAAAGIAANLVQEDQPRREGGEQRRPGMMMGGGSSMVVYKDHIFILAGPKLIKVDPNEMKVVAELQIGPGPKNDQPKEGDKRDK